MAQLVARYVRDVEAAGSSPVIPTNSFQTLGNPFKGFLFLSLKRVTDNGESGKV